MSYHSARKALHEKWRQKGTGLWHPLLGQAWGSLSPLSSSGTLSDKSKVPQQGLAGLGFELGCLTGPCHQTQVSFLLLISAKQATTAYSSRPSALPLPGQPAGWRKTKMNKGGPSACLPQVVTPNSLKGS